MRTELSALVLLPVLLLAACPKTQAPVEESPAEAVPEATKARLALLEQRASRRAYDGAPPVIPHEVDATSVAACLGCHANGMDMGDRVAPAIPHAPFTSCTQCHAQTQPGPVFAALDPASSLSAGNTFQGLAAEPFGPRASEAAPPQIPHTTRLRENCASCHGVNGPANIRSPHLDRPSCTQCHAPSAALDQRP